MSSPLSVFFSFSLETAISLSLSNCQDICSPDFGPLCFCYCYCVRPCFCFFCSYFLFFLSHRCFFTAFSWFFRFLFPRSFVNACYLGRWNTRVGSAAKNFFFLLSKIYSSAIAESLRSASLSISTLSIMRLSAFSSSTFALSRSSSIPLNPIENCESSSSTSSPLSPLASLPSLLFGPNPAYPCYCFTHEISPASGSFIILIERLISCCGCCFLLTDILRL